ncbi:MAG: conjugal transfer protein TraF [Planctomycetota bacterium]|nr:conjugal transfer protein TraF [Planctomycetota bacterium]
MRLASCALLVVALALDGPAFGQAAGARQLSLGGAGTASARAQNSAFVNPALAQRARNSDRIEITAPVLTFVAADESNLRKGVEDLQASIDALQGGLGSANEAAQRNALASDLSALAGGELFADAGIGASFVLPRGSVSLGLTWRSFVDLRGLTSIDPADLTTINSTVDPLDLDQLSSEVLVPSVRVDELGFTFATDFSLFGLPSSAGVTPKFQSVESRLYSVSVSQADQSDIVSGLDDGETRRDDIANVDVGLAVDLSPRLRAGIATRNLLRHTFEAPTISGTAYAYEVEPLTTAGLAYGQDGWLVTADLDLNSTSRFQGLASSRFLRLGGELSLGTPLALRGLPGHPHLSDVQGSSNDAVVLRAGFMTDLDSTQQDLWTLGVAFPTYLQAPLEATFAVGTEAFGAALQFGWSI